MPIEIKELHIRVNVTPPASQQNGADMAVPGGRPSKFSGKDKQEIIAECVEQVMKILENKKER